MIVVVDRLSKEQTYSYDIFVEDEEHLVEGVYRISKIISNDTLYLFFYRIIKNNDSNSRPESSNNRK